MAEQAALERLLADLRSPIDESALSESFSDVGLEDLLVAAAAGDGGSDGDREEGGGEDLPVSGRVVASLQAENASLRRRAKLAAAQAQADLQTYRATAEAAQARTRDEVTSLREALLAVQVEMPKLRDRLVASKQEFASLRISAEQYRAIVTQEHRPQATPKRQAAPDATHRRRACACSQRLHPTPAHLVCRRTSRRALCSGCRRGCTRCSPRRKRPLTGWAPAHRLPSPSRKRALGGASARRAARAGDGGRRGADRDRRAAAGGGRRSSRR